MRTDADIRFRSAASRLRGGGRRPGGCDAAQRLPSCASILVRLPVHDSRTGNFLKVVVAGLGVLLGSAGSCAEPLEPLPTRVDVDTAKAALGERLFHDPILAKDGTISCASCHDLATGGDDGRVVSEGVDGTRGMVNSPTVFNVRYNIAQFWDGRAETLEEQIDGPIQNEIEMANLWPEVVTRLEEHDEYPRLFNAVYPGQPIARDNVKNAIAEFMRSLITPNSRFDQWLNGDEHALSDLEKEGYKLFKAYGCASCHQGRNVGGNMFQIFGVLNDYFGRRGNITRADMGRFNVTGNEEDRHAFKVPSLRMAVHTAPYLHDGSAKTLRDAVDAMFEFQLGRTAPDSDKDAIVAFIKTLAGKTGGTSQ